MKRAIATAYDRNRSTSTKKSYPRVTAESVLSKRKPSTQQQAVLDAVLGRNRNITVQACAGSAKTTTGEMAVATLSKAGAKHREILYCAYSKAIALELEERLSGLADVRTTYQIGRAACCRHFERDTGLCDEWKYRELAKVSAKQIRGSLLRFFGEKFLPSEWSISFAIEKIVDFAQVNLTDPEDDSALARLVDYYSIDLPAHCGLTVLAPHVRSVMSRGIKSANDGERISFSDMVWLPHVLKMEVAKYRTVFIDELQDTSAAQLDLMLKLPTENGMMVGVGDSAQSIFQFAGAIDGMHQFSEALKTVQYPLTTCYRCPKEVIALAQTLVPEIQAAEGAPDGIVDYMHENDIVSYVRETGTSNLMILSRKTAPLIKQCLSFIENRIPAHIKGKDIGGTLAAFIKQIAEQPGFQYSQFKYFISKYLNEQLPLLREWKQQVLYDKAEGVSICYRVMNDCRNADQLVNQVRSIFSEDGQGVCLGTVHRSKGLQSPRTLILKPEDMPLVWPGQQDHEFKVEAVNLRYVAWTRAQYVRDSAGNLIYPGELYFIESGVQ